MNANRYRILCVDDEPNVLNALKRLLRRENYDIMTATSGREGLEILSRGGVQLVLCDQRMPEMTGNEFLEVVRERHPEIVRITLTGYTEVDAITESINRGHIYKFFLKPWNDQQLKLEIRQALKYYELCCDIGRLNAQLREKNRELETVNTNLEALVEERTEELACRNQALELSHAVLDSIPIPVAGISYDGTIVLANLDARNFFSHTAPCAVGVPMAEGLPREVCNLVGTVLAEGRPKDCLLPLTATDACRVRGIPLRDKRINQGVIITTEAVSTIDKPTCA
jgi:CheY-like chemotaxis protein